MLVYRLSYREHRNAEGAHDTQDAANDDEDDNDDDDARHVMRFSVASRMRAYIFNEIFSSSKKKTLFVFYPCIYSTI